MINNLFKNDTIQLGGINCAKFFLPDQSSKLYDSREKIEMK